MLEGKPAKSTKGSLAVRGAVWTIWHDAHISTGLTTNYRYILPTADI